MLNEEGSKEGQAIDVELEVDDMTLTPSRVRPD